MQTATAKKIEIEELPTEIPACHELILGLQDHVHQLSHQLDWFKRHVFGKRSEKLPDNAAQLSLLAQIDPMEQKGSEQPVIEIPAHSRKKHPGRTKLPQEFPRKREEYYPAEKTCSGCSKELTRIGQDVTEVLEYQPASLFICEHVSVKYACSCCKEKIYAGQIPVDAQVADGGRAGASLAAHVITAKYADHLPLHRQERIFLRHGIKLSRSTLCDWVAQGAQVLEPVYNALKKEILATGYVQADETPVKVQGDANGILRGQLWGIRSGVKAMTAFRYDESRSAEAASELLGEFEGYIQTDAFAGYNNLFTADGAKRKQLGCWAHVRRKFFEAQNASAIRAQQMLLLIRQLYAIERDVKKEPPEEKQRVRAECALPVLSEIKQCLDYWITDELPKSPLFAAVQYALNQWPELVRYTEDGRLRIDNNAIEQEIRPIAVGRKNWLFCGSHAGATRAALLYSLVNTCRLNAIDPFAYISDVIRKVRRGHDPTSLTPIAWKAALV
jgi:transposase